jgi:hypothetical protein
MLMTWLIPYVFDSFYPASYLMDRDHGPLVWAAIVRAMVGGDFLVTHHGPHIFRSRSVAVRSRLSRRQRLLSIDKLFVSPASFLIVDRSRDNPGQSCYALHRTGVHGR